MESDKMDIINLVFEGGGVLGSAYIGAIQEIKRRGLMKNIQNYAGSSVGALLATVLACGADMSFIESEFEKIDFPNLKDGSWGITRDLWRLYSKYGYYHGGKLLKLFEKYIKELTGNSQHTFAELYKAKDTTLIITGTNLNKQKTILFSRKTYPDMPIAFALRISCSFPYFFKAIKFEKDIYVDGGLLMNLPIAVFDDDYPKKQTLGLKLINNNESKPRQDIHNFKNFTETMINSIYNQSQEIYFQESDWNRTIKINVGNYSTLDFNITARDKEWLKEQGVRDTEIFIEKHK